MWRSRRWCEEKPILGLFVQDPTDLRVSVFFLAEFSNLISALAGNVNKLQYVKAFQEDRLSFFKYWCRVDLPLYSGMAYFNVDIYLFLCYDLVWCNNCDDLGEIHVWLLKFIEFCPYFSGLFSCQSSSIPTCGTD